MARFMALLRRAFSGTVSDENPRQKWPHAYEAVALDMLSGVPLAEIGSKLDGTAGFPPIPVREREPLMVEAWCHAVELALEHHVISEDEEKNLGRYLNFPALKHTLVRTQGYQDYVNGWVLRMLLDRKLIWAHASDETLPFNLQKDEYAIWAWEYTDLVEDKIRREYVGLSHGFSIRLAKGLYYRPSVFKGRSFETTTQEVVDQGILVATDKHIYFGGRTKHFRIPYNKIVSFVPYQQGVGIVQRRCECQTTDISNW